WLLERAAAAFRASQMPGGDHYQVLLTVLLSAFAAEALVNRLLEPVLSADEWAKVEESEGTPEKWALLYKYFKKEADPIALGRLKGLFKLRNDLVHLKHTDSLILKEQQVPFGWAMNPSAEPPGGIQDVVQDPKLRERLESSRATEYYGCVH